MEVACLWGILAGFSLSDPKKMYKCLVDKATGEIAAKWKYLAKLTDLKGSPSKIFFVRLYPECELHQVFEIVHDRRNIV